MRLEPKYNFVPILVGNDKKPVALFELIETLDEMIDYNNIKAEFPTLSFAQIDSAFSFLRKVAQFNALGIDFDMMDDEDIATNKELLDELRRASNDAEAARVLDHD